MQRLSAKAKAGNDTFRKSKDPFLTDDQAVLRLLRESAALGDLVAKLSMGDVSRSLGTSAALSEAADWFREAAEAGSIEAHRNLAEMIGNGVGIPQDRRLAERHLRLWFEAMPVMGNEIWPKEKVPGPKDALPIIDSSERADWLDLFLIPDATATGWINESRAIERFASDVKRVGDRLYLRVADGREVILEDLGWNESEEYRTEKQDVINYQRKQFQNDPFSMSFRFLSHYRSFGFYIVSYGVYFHDGGTFFVDRRRGCWIAADQIRVIPRFNPSANHFAFVSAAEAYDFNGIEIWSARPGELRLEYRFEPGHYALHRFLEWVDADTLKVAAMSIDSTGLSFEHVFHIRRNNGIWAIEDHPLPFPLVDCLAIDMASYPGVQCYFPQ